MPSDVNVASRRSPSRRGNSSTSCIAGNQSASLPFSPNAPIDPQPPAAVHPIVTFVAGVRLNAQNCPPSPLRLLQQAGWPHLIRVRLLSLAAYAEDAATSWTPSTVVHWYGEYTRSALLRSCPASCYRSGLPPITIRSRAHAYPRNKFAAQTFLCQPRCRSAAHRLLPWSVTQT